MINKLLVLAKGLQWYDIVVLIVFPTVLFPFYLGIKKHINKSKTNKMSVTTREIEHVIKVYECSVIEAVAFLESPSTEVFVFRDGRVYPMHFPNAF